MELVDTHCHIQSAGAQGGERSTRELWSKGEHLTVPQLVSAAEADGATRMVCVGCDYPDSQLAIETATSQPNCYASIGLHPHEAQRYSNNDADMAAFCNLVTQPKVVAVGECGLDYFYEHSPKTDQEKILRLQIELALANNLPLIFHVREAFTDFWPIFDQYQGIRGVLHSFTDSAENLEQAIQRGLYIGVNGIATFAKNPAQVAIYQQIPVSNLVLETDAPFLTPVPYRGKINEPKHVLTVAQFLADLRAEPVEQLAQATTANARTLFGI